MATKTKPVEKDMRTQRQKFVDAGKEHGADEDRDAFRRAVRQVATAPVQKPKKAARKGRS